jgi:hypothetical protein
LDFLDECRRGLRSDDAVRDQVVGGLEGDDGGPSSRPEVSIDDDGWLGTRRVEQRLQVDDRDTQRAYCQEGIAQAFGAGNRLPATSRDARDGGLSRKLAREIRWVGEPLDASIGIAKGAVRDSPESLDAVGGESGIG